MTITPGTVIGQYRIDARLGGGGMGEVYKATHLILGRQVALKTLAKVQMGSESPAARFVQEARAASELHHPNIVAVYDVMDLDGNLFIAMEYVKGSTLREILEKRVLAPKEAVTYAVQIAGALAAAHAAGILHRDIKPANVMITPRNAVKVLDFGLAKRFYPNVAADAPTLTMVSDPHLTEEGRVSGTPAYMSPEQLQGLALDARSDVFSFGTLLYQMLAGVNPFDAPSRAGIVANILRVEPRPLSQVRPGISKELDELVRFCLCKAPEERAHSVHDVAHMLEHARMALERSPAEAETKGGGRRAWWLAGAAAAALVLGWAGGAIFTPSAGVKEPPRPALRRITWDAGLNDDPALSSDGHLLAFSSNRASGRDLDIFVRLMSGGEPIRLTSDPADESAPSFSPDGGVIAFRSERRGGGIYTIPSFGGQERLVAPRGNSPRFSPDGRRIAYWIGEVANRTPSGRIYVVPAPGGEPTQIQPAFADARNPVWTPDGEHLLFEGVDLLKAGAEPSRDWWVTPLDGGRAVRTGASAALARAGLTFVYPPGGWRGGGIVFSAQDDTSRAIFEMPVSARTWQAPGPPRALTFGTGTDGSPYPSPDGTIAFTSYQYEINVWSNPLDASGRVTDKTSRKLTLGAAFHRSASVDADGSRLIYVIGRIPSRAVRIRDMATGREAAVDSGGGDQCSAAISGDGSKVAWSVCGMHNESVYVARVDGDLSLSVSQKVCGDCGGVADWSRAGDAILFVDRSSPARTGILDLASDTRTMIASARERLDNPRFSPDGDWIALTAKIPGEDRSRILAIPLHAGKPAPESDWVPVTAGDFWDDNPVWTERGDALLFYSRRDGFGCIWRQTLNRATRRPEGSPAEVLEFHAGRLSLRDLVSGMQFLSIADHRILFNALESAGSIWTLRGGGL